MDANRTHVMKEGDLRLLSIRRKDDSQYVREHSFLVYASSTDEARYMCTGGSTESSNFILCSGHAFLAQLKLVLERRT